MAQLVIAGLGNPGPRYAGTRHNVGFDVALRVVARLGAIPDGEPAREYAAWFTAARIADEAARGVAVVQPLLFMNRSGEALEAFRRRRAFEPADCLVIVDDVYLPLGRIRLRARGSAGGHNGLASVAEALGTLDFPRLRIGVGRGDESVDLASHVLDEFADDERGTLAEVLERSVEAAVTWASDGITAAMNRFNVPARDARDESTPQGER